MLWPCSSAPSLGWGLLATGLCFKKRSGLSGGSELSINHSSLSRHLPAGLFPRYRGGCLGLCFWDPTNSRPGLLEGEGLGA